MNSEVVIVVILAARTPQEIEHGETLAREYLEANPDDMRIPLALEQLALMRAAHLRALL